MVAGSIFGKLLGLIMVEEDWNGSLRGNGDGRLGDGAAPEKGRGNGRAVAWKTACRWWCLRSMEMASMEDERQGDEEEGEMGERPWWCGGRRDGDWKRRWVWGGVNGSGPARGGSRWCGIERRKKEGWRPTASPGSAASGGDCLERRKEAGSLATGGSEAAMARFDGGEDGEDRAVVPAVNCMVAQRMTSSDRRHGRRLRVGGGWAAACGQRHVGGGIGRQWADGGQWARRLRHRRSWSAMVF